MDKEKEEHIKRILAAKGIAADDMGRYCSRGMNRILRAAASRGRKEDVSVSDFGIDARPARRGYVGDPGRLSGTTYSDGSCCAAR